MLTVIVDEIVPSMMLSSTPVTVTVCGVFQLAFVNVRVLVTVASPVSLEEIAKTTSESGWASKTMVNVSVVPDSATLVDPLLSAMVNPATSSSVVVAVTVWSATASKLSFELPSLTLTVIVDEVVPSMRLSSTPVTVTVCGVSQLALVKVRALVTVASPVSLEVISKTTSDVGRPDRTTVNVSLVPDSATVVDPPLSVIVNPAESSSVVVVLTVWSLTESKASSELISTIEIVISNV